MILRFEVLGLNLYIQIATIFFSNDIRYNLGHFTSKIFSNAMQILITR